MADKKLSLGGAIDQMVAALESLDDKSKETAIAAVCAHLGLSSPPNSSVAPASPRAAALSSTPTSADQSPAIDIRTLKGIKNPKSANQMACLVAFYLQEHAPPAERKDSISASDIEKYFKQAGFRLPKHIAQLLKDAKRAGYFDSAGRGSYKLNAVGYNLVAHSLPGDNAE